MGRGLCRVGCQLLALMGAGRPPTSARLVQRHHANWRAPNPPPARCHAPCPGPLRSQSARAERRGAMCHVRTHCTLLIFTRTAQAWGCELRCGQHLLHGIAPQCLPVTCAARHGATCIPNPKPSGDPPTPAASVQHVAAPYHTARICACTVLCASLLPHNPRQGARLIIPHSAGMDAAERGVAPPESVISERQGSLGTSWEDGSVTGNRQRKPRSSQKLAEMQQTASVLGGEAAKQVCFGIGR